LIVAAFPRENYRCSVRGQNDGDQQAQLFQCRHSHSILGQVFAAQSWSSAYRVGVRSPLRCHMSAVKRSNRTVRASAVVPPLFLLELSAGRIHVTNTDGAETIVTDCHLPDGIVVDVEAGHIYWTNMGIPNLNDGSIERADLDGKNRKTSSHRARPTLQSRSFSKRRSASYIGAIGRACASCAAASTARSWRRSSRPSVAMPINGTRRGGASG
jgi:hypothetical protein